MKDLHGKRPGARWMLLAAVLVITLIAGAALAAETPKGRNGTEGLHDGLGIPANRQGVAEELSQEAFSPALPANAAEEGAQNPLNALNSILLAAAAAGVFGMMWVLGRSPKERTFKSTVPMVLCAAVGIRLVIALISPGYTSDMACFTGWSKALADNGPAAFYTSGMFADYPPGYLYVLWATGKLAALFGINLYAYLGSVFVRLPAILLDAALGYVLYRATRRTIGEKGGRILLLLAAFNPVSMLDSAAWGQVDSALAILLVMTFVLLKKENRLAAAAVFGLAVLVKPQALIVGPVFALAYLIPLAEGDKSRRLRAVGEILLGAGIALAVIFIGSVPFTGTQGQFWVFRRMFETATSYPYGSANAFNLIALLGGNWVQDSTVFFGLSIRHWGYLGILASFGATMIAALRARKRGTLSLPLLAALFLTLVFTLGHNMHERYLFPALFLLLLSLGELPDKRLIAAHAGLSATLFLNTAAVLLAVFYKKYNLIGSMEPAVRIFSLAGVCAAGYFAWVCWRILACGEARQDAFCAQPTEVEGT